MVPKSVQPNYGEFYDQRWFVSGHGINETEVTADLGSFQIRRDQLFNVGGHLVGVEICEDLGTNQSGQFGGSGWRRSNSQFSPVTNYQQGRLSPRIGAHDQR